MHAIVSLSQEVRLVLEDKELSDIMENAATLSSCFIIIETSVVYTARQSELSESSSNGTTGGKSK